MLTRHEVRPSFMFAGEVGHDCVAKPTPDDWLILAVSSSHSLCAAAGLRFHMFATEAVLCGACRIPWA